jgi:hypothetical protein
MTGTGHSLTRRRHLIAVVAALAVVALSGCAETAERDESGEIVEEGEVGAFDIQEGDCFNTPTQADVFEVEAVPCDEPHDDEAYAFVTIDGNVWPGDDAVGDMSFDLCLGEFASYVGAPFDVSELTFYPLTPTESSWDLGDRESICVLFQMDGEKLEGSMQGSAR